MMVIESRSVSAPVSALVALTIATSKARGRVFRAQDFVRSSVGFKKRSSDRLIMGGAGNRAKIKSEMLRGTGRSQGPRRANLKQMESDIL